MMAHCWRRVPAFSQTGSRAAGQDGVLPAKSPGTLGSGRQDRLFVDAAPGTILGTSPSWGGMESVWKAYPPPLAWDTVGYHIVSAKATRWKRTLMPSPSRTAFRPDAESATPRLARRYCLATGPLQRSKAVRDAAVKRCLLRDGISTGALSPSYITAAVGCPAREQLGSIYLRTVLQQPFVRPMEVVDERAYQQRVRGARLRAS